MFVHRVRGLWERGVAAPRSVAGLSTIPLGGMLFRIMGTSGMRQNRAGTAQNRAATLYPPIVTTAPAACTRALGYGTDLAFSG